MSDWIANSPLTHRVSPLRTFQSLGFHRQIDFDVAIGRRQAHVAEPTADDVDLDAGLEQVHGVVWRSVCGVTLRSRKLGIFCDARATARSRMSRFQND